MGSYPSGSSKLDLNGALGSFGSSKATCDRMSFTSCGSENTTGSLAENEPPDSESCLGMFGRQEGSEGSSANLTSRLTGVPGSTPETSCRRRKTDLPQTDLSVDALMFWFLKLEMTSAAHGRGVQGALLQKLNCLSARYTLQALHLKPLVMTKVQMTLVSQFVHQRPDS